MNKMRVLTAGVCLAVLAAAPVGLLAEEADSVNLVVQQAAEESLANPLIRQAVEEGQVAPTPPAAMSWQQKETERRKMQERAAAKRLQMLSGSQGDQAPGQAQ